MKFQFSVKGKLWECLGSDRIDLGFLKWRMVNIGLLHESNGRADTAELSRSWNRLYAQFGLENGNFSMLVRLRYRIPEDNRDDDNPDVTRYLGYGDLVLCYEVADHIITTPMRKRARILVQAFHGYGESLIDYNHAQNTIGIGFMLTDWTERADRAWMAGV